MVLALTLAMACLAVSTALARPSLEMRQRAQVISHCIVPGTAALTFDDGPYEYMYEITSMLRAHNVSATFFFNGENYGCIYSPENARRVKHAYDQGHQIASHTWSHADLTALSLDKISNEMQRVDKAIEKITGATPSFIRPPYGLYNEKVLRVAAARRQSIVLWDLDSGDSLNINISAQKSRYDQTLRRHPKTILALNHEVYPSTVHSVLPYAIKQLHSAGYRMVTVAECAGLSPYHSRSKPAHRDSSWHC
ncbi:carbohydrate esterase family 4 protein [Coprinellus micaceus]|uniref:Carbohydrate esterase family 4 protein n=1 Tax=Coprinellus micaceus TaxID=71717 RepID=A0A4Y7TGT7_COPMI|nr:carbohydrate esterase family 4 protein [Coprinellus micaceus]